MRGGYIHNNVLIAPIERAERARGAIVYREYRVVTPKLEGNMDLLVITKLRRRAYEAENTLDRVRWDIMKATAFPLDELVLVFPTGRLARAAQKCVDELKASGKVVRLSIVCVTVGAALQRIKDTNGTETESAGSTKQTEG